VRLLKVGADGNHKAGDVAALRVVPSEASTGVANRPCASDEN
jgi:hypothetical protein